MNDGPDVDAGWMSKNDDDVGGGVLLPLRSNTRGTGGRNGEPSYIRWR